jgi:hypothetical protein
MNSRRAVIAVCLFSLLSSLPSGHSNSVRVIEERIHFVRNQLAEGVTIDRNRLTFTMEKRCFTFYLDREVKEGIAKLYEKGKKNGLHNCVANVFLIYSFCHFVF